MESASYKNFQNLSTEDKRLEMLFKHIKDKQGKWYNTLFNQNATAIVICETDSGFPSTIVECNKEFKQVIKHTDEDIIGSDFMDLMRKGEKRKYFVQTFSYEEDKQIKDLPLTFVKGNGKEITLEISTKSFASSLGTLTMVTLRSINHHRSVLENGLEQILLNSNQVFFGIKSEEILEFNYVSLSAYKITGYSADQLILNPFLFWYNCHPEDFNKLKKTLNNNNNNDFDQNVEVRFIQQNGKMIWLNLAIVKCPDHRVDNTTYYMMVREITHPKKLQRLQEKKDKYRHLLSSIAKQLLRQKSEQDIREVINNIGRRFPAERIVIYHSNKKGNNFTHNFFKNETTIDEKAESTASSLFFQEFKDDFRTTPIILYHPDKNCYEVEQKHHHFLKKNAIDSALLVPLINKEESIGLILCSNMHYSKCWDRTEISFISELSELFSAFLS